MLKNKGWLATAAGTGINLALGVLYAWSIFKGAVKTELQVTDFEASLPYAVANGVFAIVMIFAGRMQDLLGPRVVVTLGGAMAGLGLILSYFAHSIPILVITFGVLSGIGFGLGYAATTPAAVKWFPPAMKGTIIGIVVSGFGLASVYISPLAKYLLATYGLNRSFLMLGVAFFILTILLAQLVQAPPKGYVAAGASQGPAKTATVRDYNWSEMLRTPQFYLLWVMFAAGATGGLMIIGHIATYAKSIGIDGGFFLVALLAIFNAGGRVVTGTVSDKLGRMRTLLLVFTLHTVTLLAFPYLTTLPLLAVGTAGAGFCYGSYLALIPSATYDYYGTKYSGINYGLVFTAWGIGGVFGAPLAGYIKDATGSYNLAFYVAAGLTLLAAVLTFITRSPQEKQNPVSVSDVGLAPGDD